MPTIQAHIDTEVGCMGVPDRDAERFAARGKRWYSEGKKDGLCGIMRPLKEVPTAFRLHYNSGHTYGMFTREAG